MAFFDVENKTTYEIYQRAVPQKVSPQVPHRTFAIYEGAQVGKILSLDLYTPTECIYRLVS